jgi:hypothetical protein
VTGLVRYTLTAEIEGPPRTSERARRAEPGELFGVLIDGITAAGFHVVGEVSVRPHGPCWACGASYCEEHGA